MADFYSKRMENKEARLRNQMFNVGWLCVKQIEAGVYWRPPTKTRYEKQLLQRGYPLIGVIMVTES